MSDAFDRPTIDPFAVPLPAARAAGWGRAGDYLWAALMVSGVTASAGGLSHILSLGNVALLYLLPVMAAANLFGLRPGLFAGIASTLAYNFFFLPPTGSLSIGKPENVVSVVVLLGVAVVTSQFAARLRAQADIAAASAEANAALAGFLRRLTATAGDAQLAQAICAEVARLFGVRAVLLAPSPAGPEVRAAAPPEDGLDTIARAAASWTLDRGVPAGRGSDTLTASDWLFHPLRGTAGTLAAIGMARDDGRDPVPPDRLPLLASLLDQATLALERARLEHETRDLVQLKERDRLRAALLSSVSHDLRTPLTAILAAAAALRRDATPALIDAIQSEAERLNRFVANLLDMARVEAGALRLKREPIDLTDAIAGAVHDMRRTLEGHAIVLELSPGLPFVTVDPQLFHHCLINLLDNAGRYADPATPVTIRAERRAGGLTLSILDRGPGLPAGRETEVFDTFRRFEGSDRAPGGTGLGLAIVKGFAEAMGIGVAAANRIAPRGACLSLHFPEALLVQAGDLETEP